MSYNCFNINRSTENSIHRTTDKQYETNEELLQSNSIEDHRYLKTENNPSPIKINVNSPEKSSINIVESLEPKNLVHNVKSAIFIQKDEEIKSSKADEHSSKIYYFCNLI